MINILLQKIKELETELKEIKQKNSFAKEKILELFKECKIPKEKKSKFKLENPAKYWCIFFEKKWFTIKFITKIKIVKNKNLPLIKIRGIETKAKKDKIKKTK